MRIQVLELPAIVADEAVTTPFALVFDDLSPAVHAAEAQDRAERMANFTDATGASGFFANPETVTIIDRFQDVEVATEVTEESRPVEIHYYGDPADVAKAVARNHAAYFSSI